jgi:hypothetical protein
MKIEVRIQYFIERYYERLLDYYSLLKDKEWKKTTTSIDMKFHIGIGKNYIDMNIFK